MEFKVVGQSNGSLNSFVFSRSLRKKRLVQCPSLSYYLKTSSVKVNVFGVWWCRIIWTSLARRCATRLVVGLSRTERQVEGTDLRSLVRTEDGSPVDETWRRDRVYGRCSYVVVGPGSVLYSLNDLYLRLTFRMPISVVGKSRGVTDRLLTTGPRL